MRILLLRAVLSPHGLYNSDARAPRLRRERGKILRLRHARIKGHFSLDRLRPQTIPGARHIPARRVDGRRDGSNDERQNNRPGGQGNHRGLLLHERIG